MFKDMFFGRTSDKDEKYYINELKKETVKNYNSCFTELTSKTKKLKRNIESKQSIESQFLINKLNETIERAEKCIKRLSKFDCKKPENINLKELCSLYKYTFEAMEIIDLLDTYNAEIIKYS